MKSAVLEDPAWIPHALEKDGIVMARLVEDVVRRAAFLDGREPFADEALTIGHADLMRGSSRWPSDPVPTILHVSFCGSTALSRLLDQPGRTIVYREPAIQIALADRIKSGSIENDRITAITAAFARPLRGQRVLVKPSNWANALLPVWSVQRSILPVFVTMAARPFLTAVFRGDRERIAYTIRVADHLSRLVPEGAAVLQAASGASDDPLLPAARLVLAALSFQLTLFAEAQTLMDTHDSAIDASEIFADPHGAARRAGGMLGLGDIDPALPVDDHSKNSGHYSRDDEDAANRRLEKHHAATFDAALAWAAHRRLRLSL